jgi:type IV pilus assembly protein PilC
MTKFHVLLRKSGVPDENRTIDAPSRFAVYTLLKDEGVAVVDIKETKAWFDFTKKLNISFGSGVKRREIITTAKNLSAMLSAGLSLSRALSILERQSSNKRLRAVSTGLSEAIKKGASFHEALAGYPHVFPPLFIAMVRAGEESGALADSLKVISIQMERSEELVRKIKGAMIYPGIVITAIIIVAILMLMFVVPTLTSTFEQLNVEIPITTKIIVMLSDFMINHMVLVLLLLVALFVSGILFVRSSIGRALVLAGALRFPIIRELVRETYAARASRTLSSLLTSGVPILEALVITREVVRARVFADVIAEAEAHVKKGEPLSAAFSDHAKLYPILMSDMLSVGEETGKVAEMLKQIAEFYEGDVAEKTKDLSTIIEPVLMLLIGAVVGVFAVSMIAPIYSLSSAI